MPRVFVSSTCYDLVDLRAELQDHLRSLRLTPVLSDSENSNFTVHPDKNSIETCLVNVRSSDIFICVLSQRYGPRLGKLGFEDVSATHLEYLTAQADNIPIYMYLRDRLEAEFNLSKKNPSMNYAWTSKKDAPGLFDLIAKHRTLSTNTTSSNWISTFTSSNDLKTRLTSDLASVAGKAALEDITHRGRLPILLIHPDGGTHSPPHRQAELKFRVRNASKEPAINVSFESDFSKLRRDLGSLAPEASVSTSFGLTMPKDKNEHVGQLRLRFTTTEGHIIQDEHQMNYVWTSIPTVELLARRYIQREGIAFLAETDT